MLHPQNCCANEPFYIYIFDTLQMLKRTHNSHVKSSLLVIYEQIRIKCCNIKFEILHFSFTAAEVVVNHQSSLFDVGLGGWDDINVSMD